MLFIAHFYPRQLTYPLTHRHAHGRRLEYLAQGHFYMLTAHVGKLLADTLQNKHVCVLREFMPAAGELLTNMFSCFLDVKQIF